MPLTLTLSPKGRGTQCYMPLKAPSAARAVSAFS